jgi:hypothetical protein
MTFPDLKTRAQKASRKPGEDSDDFPPEPFPTKLPGRVPDNDPPEDPPENPTDVPPDAPLSDPGRVAVHPRRQALIVTGIVFLTVLSVTAVFAAREIRALDKLKEEDRRGVVVSSPDSRYTNSSTAEILE